MKSMKLMLPALLLSLSLGAFAQDDDELMDATSEEDAAAEVFVPSHPWEKPIFHRVELGYSGTFAKYTNNNPDPTILGDESHYLSGINLGWMTDIVLTKNRKVPLYIEVGALLKYQTGHYNGTNDSNSSLTYDWTSRINAFSLTIPVNLNYQFRDFRGVEGLTLAPFVGLYARFNLVVDRSLDKTTTHYNYTENGEKVIDEKVTVSETKSLMKDYNNDGWTKSKNHTGKLIQYGTQLGVNAFYKRYSFGLSYMFDISPFAECCSEDKITYKPKDAGGRDNIPGTGCDMEMSTRHNFAITVGYFF